MALGDIGMFLPGESAYQKPGTYDDALRAEAVKSASYLASMDQFYANLEEAKSEFGQTLAFKEKELATNKELGEAGINIQQQQVDINKEQLAWEKQYQGGLLSNQQEAIFLAQQEQSNKEDLQQELLKMKQASLGYGSSLPSWERPSPGVSFVQPTTPDKTGDYGYATESILAGSNEDLSLLSDYSSNVNWSDFDVIY